MDEPNKNQSIGPVVAFVVVVLFLLVGPVVIAILNQAQPPESRTTPGGTDAETAVDVEPAPELAMRIVYGDSHWRWIVPLLIFFLVIDGTVITMYLASISKKLDRLPQAPSP